MEKITKHLSRKATNAAQEGLTELSSNKSTVVWENYNYPPLIRLFHFSTGALKTQIKIIVWAMHVNFLLNYPICCINCKFSPLSITSPPSSPGKDETGVIYGSGIGGIVVGGSENGFINDLV